MKKTVKKIEGMSMKEWILSETRRRKTTWWGSKCYIKPVICSKIFGDGLQLAYLGTIDQRPHYWLIRIDSGIDLQADDFDYEKHLLEPLEEEFGRFPEAGYISYSEYKQLKKKSTGCIHDYDSYKDYNNACKYPALYWGGGHWGTVVNFKS